MYFCLITYRVVHLVVSCNVFVKSSQHDHGYHTRQEQHNDKRVHDTGNKDNKQEIKSKLKNKLEKYVCKCL